MTAQTLFGQPSSPTTLASDNTDYTMGMEFSLSADAPLTGIWFFSPSGAGALPTQCGIFKVSDQSIVTSATSPSWSGAAGDGWVKCTFDGSDTLTASTNYKVAVAFSFGQDHYGVTAHYWDSGAGASGLSAGIITAPNNAGGDGGQDTFFSGTADVLHYPSSSFNAGNYWIDVEVTPSGGGSVTGTGSVSLHKLGLSGSGGEKNAGTGSVAIHKLGLSGTATAPLIGTGSVSLHKMSLSGSGTEKNSGTGSVALHKLGLSGTGNAPLIGTGSVSLHKMGLDGSGDVQGTVAGSGSVALKKMSLSGSGTAPVVGTGSVALKKMGVQGSNLVAPPVLDASLLAGHVTAVEYGGAVRAAEYAGAVSAQAFGGAVT